MVKKILGYILGLAGIAVIALSFPQIKTLANIPIPSSLTDIYLMIIGVTLLLLGAFLAFGKGKSKQSQEVPIYHGNHIVGYRRTK